MLKPLHIFERINLESFSCCVFTAAVNLAKLKLFRQFYIMVRQFYEGKTTVHFMKQKLKHWDYIFIFIFYFRLSVTSTLQE